MSGNNETVQVINGSSKPVINQNALVRKNLFQNCDPYSQLAIAEVRDSLDALGVSTIVAKTSPVHPDYGKAEKNLRRAIDILISSAEEQDVNNTNTNVTNEKSKHSVQVPSALIDDVSRWLNEIYSVQLPYRYPYSSVHSVLVPKKDFATDLNAFGELRILDDEPVKVEISRLFDWQNFDVFHLQKVTGGHALSTIMTHAFHHFNLFHSLKIDRTLFSNFWRRIELGYKDVPYHNVVHAADVLQELAWFVNTSPIRGKLTAIEKCACLFAAGVHDHDHPGLNNDFLIKTNHELALRYNDKSVLENHHVSSSLELLFGFPQYNFLSHLDNDTINYFRSIVIDMVLGTDMSIHFKLQADYKSTFENGIEPRNQKERTLLMTMLVHAADLGNCGKPFKFAEKWGERVITEFYLQGDKESNLGLPVTPMNNRETCCFEDCQIGFLNFIIIPMLEILANSIPELSLNLAFAKENCEMWKLRLARIKSEKP